MLIEPPTALFAMPLMSVNCWPKVFHWPMAWLMGDVTMPDTLPTVEHTFFCAYLSTASWAEDRIEPREGIENDRSMIWLTLAKQASFTSKRLSTFGVAEAIWLCAPMAVLMFAPMPTSSQFLRSSCIFWVIAASTAAISDETPELAPLPPVENMDENQLPLVWDAPALAASARDAPTSTTDGGLGEGGSYSWPPPRMQASWTVPGCGSLASMMPPLTLRT